MWLARHLLRAIAIACLVATPAFAADQPVLPPLPPLTQKAAPNVEYFMPKPVPSWQVEFAARYWYGRGKTGESLYDNPALSDTMVSRLTYSGMTSNSGELYGRAAATTGWFVKGYVGGGVISQGRLQDEDFPPYAVPYSSTISDEHSGHLDYASGDVGYDVVRGADFRLGAFVGYHYFNEVVNSFGCRQTTDNLDICVPSVPASVESISQNNTWQSMRLGMDGSVQIGERVTLSAEGAWLPYVHLDGYDAHWLRIGTAPGDFTGPIQENGQGQGYQLEALVSYALTNSASIGVGARYWHMQANGDTHFENHVVDEDVGPQPSQWKTDIYGVFVQASLKFGPYPIAMHQ